MLFIAPLFRLKDLQGDLVVHHMQINCTEGQRAQKILKYAKGMRFPPESGRGCWYCWHCLEFNRRLYIQGKWLLTKVFLYSNLPNYTNNMVSESLHFTFLTVFSQYGLRLTASDCALMNLFVHLCLCLTNHWALWNLLRTNPLPWKHCGSQLLQWFCKAVTRIVEFQSLMGLIPTLKRNNRNPFEDGYVY